MRLLKKTVFAAILFCASVQNGWTAEPDKTQEDSLTITLGEVTVKGDAMRTIVNGSVLEQTTTATEMLKYIPNVNAESGSVSVMGCGSSEVYINGRQLRDLKELDQINPALIQYVDVG